MERVCQKCGNKIRDGANFCTGCGQPVEKISNGSNKQEWELIKKVGKEKASEGIAKAEDLLINGISKGKDKLTEYQNMSEEEKMEKKQQYIDGAKKKSEEFASDIKNFQTLPKKRKKKLVLTICGVIIVFFALFSLFGKGKYGKMTPDDKIAIAQSIPLGYLPAGELLSSGGAVPVAWKVYGENVEVRRDGICFVFVINSDGTGYLDRAEQGSQELSPEALEVVLDSYYEIGSLRGTL